MSLDNLDKCIYNAAVGMPASLPKHSASCTHDVAVDSLVYLPIDLQVLNLVADLMCLALHTMQVQ